MFYNTLKILQINTKDTNGGAEKIATTLHQYYQLQNITSWLAVGYKKSKDPTILNINNDLFRTYWTQSCLKLADVLTPHKNDNQPENILRKTLKYFIAQPQRWLERQQGKEWFNHPATQHLLDLTPTFPDIIHAHNLHGEYFDLQQLPYLSHQISFIITLHDAWLLSGHCAHSFDCERWITGCGNCPDLNIPPAIKRDATAYNWQRKKEIYKESKLYIATPSQWLMDKVKNSILAPAIIESCVIPNGIDLNIFYPKEENIRARLNIPKQAKVILFAANGIKNNIWKDYQTMQKAIIIVSQNLPKKKIYFLALGENNISEKIGNALIKFIPYTNNSQDIADYYRAADIYVHAAKAETFGLVITEALACGTPIVATNVGGIPEQVEHGKTGFLTPIGDPLSMALAIQNLLEDDYLWHKMSEQAVKTAGEKFDVERMANAYLDWYKNILKTRNETHFN